jgi:hypothetical protein
MDIPTESVGNTLPDSRFSKYDAANTLQSERLRHAYASSYNENPISDGTEVEVGHLTSETDVGEWSAS